MARPWPVGPGASVLLLGSASARCPGCSQTFARLLSAAFRRNFTLTPRDRSAFVPRRSRRSPPAAVGGVARARSRARRRGPGRTGPARGARSCPRRASSRSRRPARARPSRRPGHGRTAGLFGSRSGRYSMPGYQVLASVKTARRPLAERVAREVVRVVGRRHAVPERVPPHGPERDVHGLLAGRQVVEQARVRLPRPPLAAARVVVAVHEQDRALRPEARRVDRFCVSR